jgi:hypothetical protein
LKTLLTILTSLLFATSWANMASPIEQEGTLGATPFISKYVDILKEKITITPDEKFKKAHFKVEYHLQSEKNGVQIPLLFVAKEFSNGISVMLDGKKILLMPVPKKYMHQPDSPFSDFSDSFEKESEQNVTIRWSEDHGYRYKLSDLFYFEADLSEGIHIVTVEYDADRRIDQSNWVKEYSFLYSLSPAKHWRSFGELEVVLDASKCKKSLKTNFGFPVKRNLQSIKKWTFSSLPGEFLQVKYTPKINKTAQILIAITPTGLTVIFAIVMSLVHFFLLKELHKKNHLQWAKWLFRLGVFIVPFLVLRWYMYTFNIIDNLIGEEASRYHGYTFFVFILYPFVMPCYWLFLFFVKEPWVKKMQENKEVTNESF